MTISFAPGTPPEARQALEGWLAVGADLPPNLRTAIERLATNESMEPFWKQLPPPLQGRAADIISWTIEAFIEADSLPPPPAVHRKELHEFKQAHGPITDPAKLAEFRALMQKLYPVTYPMISDLARTLGGYLR